MEELKLKAEKLVEICKRRAIIFPSAEIYGGFAGFFEYGPVGVLLKRKYVEWWREYFVRSEENVVEMEGSTILPEIVWEASGHLQGFVDPITQCKHCKALHRADHLIEEALGLHVEGKGLDELTQILQGHGMRCPHCKGELGEVKIFNLLLCTQVGPANGDKACLRAETAQNMFTAFKRIANAMRAKLPFGIAQVGKAYRNEISPRHFVVRIREFNQCEIEMFVDPERIDECPSFEAMADVKLRIHTIETQRRGKEPIELSARQALELKILPHPWMAYFLAKEFVWFQQLGIPSTAMRFRQMLPEETPHYSKGNFDLEILFAHGWQECVGNAYRSDYDLKRHASKSRADLSIAMNGRKVIPHVIEPSFGVERPLAAVLLYCLRLDGRGWSWFQFPPRLAPYAAGIFPLLKRQEMVEVAKKIYLELKPYFDVFYDESGSIGKRYARADEIGTPYCITCDHQTLQDSTVTLRWRDDCSQLRIRIKDLKRVLECLLTGVQFKQLVQLFPCTPVQSGA